MRSINKHRVRQRISNIWDTTYGAQAQGKDIKKYTKELAKQVDIHREGMGDSKDFARDFGSI